MAPTILGGHIATILGGHIATLAHYGQTTFDPGTVNNASPNLVTSDGGVTIQHRTPVSTPSLPDNDAQPDGFNIAHGSTSPSSPSS